MIDPLFSLSSTTFLLQVILITLGMSYVLTGSVIGFYVRFVWWHLTHRLGNLKTLAFCPSCSSWWIGGLLSLGLGATWPVILQCAFASCGVAAIVQSQFGLAAEDEDIISGKDDE